MVRREIRLFISNPKGLRKVCMNRMCKTGRKFFTPKWRKKKTNVSSPWGPVSTRLLKKLTWLQFQETLAHDVSIKKPSLNALVRSGALGGGN